MPDVPHIVNPLQHAINHHHSELSVRDQIKLCFKTEAMSSVHLVSSTIESLQYHRRSQGGAQGARAPPQSKLH